MDGLGAVSEKLLINFNSCWLLSCSFLLAAAASGIAAYRPFGYITDPYVGIVDICVWQHYIECCNSRLCIIVLIVLASSQVDFFILASVAMPPEVRH